MGGTGGFAGRMSSMEKDALSSWPALAWGVTDAVVHQAHAEPHRKPQHLPSEKLECLITSARCAFGKDHCRDGHAGLNNNGAKASTLPLCRPDGPQSGVLGLPGRSFEIAHADVLRAILWNNIEGGRQLPTFSFSGEDSDHPEFAVLMHRFYLRLLVQQCLDFQRCCPGGLLQCIAWQ